MNRRFFMTGLGAITVLAAAGVAEAKKEPYEWWSVGMDHGNIGVLFTENQDGSGQQRWLVIFANGERVSHVLHVNTRTGVAKVWEEMDVWETGHPLRVFSLINKDTAQPAYMHDCETLAVPTPGGANLTTVFPIRRIMVTQVIDAGEAVNLHRAYPAATGEYSAGCLNMPTDEQCASAGPGEVIVFPRAGGWLWTGREESVGTIPPRTELRIRKT